MKQSFPLLILSLVLLFSSASAVLADGNEKPVTTVVAPPLHLKRSKHDKTFDVFQNQEVIVTLKDCSASTGFVWDFDKTSAHFLELEDISSLPSSSDAIGAPVKRVWTFKVIGTPLSKGDLTFFQKRPWSQDQTPSNEVTFHLNFVDSFQNDATLLRVSSLQ